MSKPLVYNQFCIEMCRRGLIEFERMDDTAFIVGCFCALKKSGAVFDTRLANAEFLDPPTTGGFHPPRPWRRSR